jgi:hypothetical protein
VRFHGRQDTELALYSASVVIADEILNHIDQSFLAVEPLTVVAFPLEDTPEALHGAIVNAMCNTGHTLRHTRFLNLVVKGSVRILQSPVTME